MSQKLELGQLSPTMDRALDRLQQLTVEEQMELLEKARGGDIEARNAFIESTLPMTRFLLRKHYRDQDIEEGLQDFVLHMLKYYAAYDSEKGAISTYLRVILREMYNDKFRARNAACRTGETFVMAPEALDTYVSCVDTEAFADELREKLLEAVNDMASARHPLVGRAARARAAKVLRLAYGLDGSEPMSNTEIGIMQGRSQQAVSHDKQFGLAQLRRMPKVRELMIYLREE
jgi:RNA polymerase sigma factor (sigma-70 family)